MPRRKTLYGYVSFQEKPNAVNSWLFSIEHPEVLIEQFQGKLINVET
jgi:hypothetical protein